jgi:hypothetical protein
LRQETDGDEMKLEKNRGNLIFYSDAGIAAGVQYRSRKENGDFVYALIASVDSRTPFFVELYDHKSNLMGSTFADVTVEGDPSFLAARAILGRPYSELNEVRSGERVSTGFLAAIDLKQWADFNPPLSVDEKFFRGC